MTSKAVAFWLSKVKFLVGVGMAGLSDVVQSLLLGFIQYSACVAILPLGPILLTMTF